MILQAYQGDNIAPMGDSKLYCLDSFHQTGFTLDIEVSHC